MQLKEFIEKKGLKNYQFAQAIGIASPHLSEILHGRRGIPLKVAIRILEVTEGDVTLLDLASIPNNRIKRKAKDKSAPELNTNGHSSVNLQAAQEWCQKYLRQGQEE